MQMMQGNSASVIGNWRLCCCCWLGMNRVSGVPPPLRGSSVSLALAPGSSNPSESMMALTSDDGRLLSGPATPPELALRRSNGDWEARGTCWSVKPKRKRNQAIASSLICSKSLPISLSNSSDGGVIGGAAGGGGKDDSDLEGEMFMNSSR